LEYNIFPLLADFRYFMRELLALGAVEKAQLSVYLTSWVDKNSPLCMYTMTHTHIWSNAHLFHKDDLKLRADIRRYSKGLPLLHLEGMDGNQPLANHQC
jgi:hypothetical protein